MMALCCRCADLWSWLAQPTEPHSTKPAGVCCKCNCCTAAQSMLQCYKCAGAPTPGAVPAANHSSRHSSKPQQQTQQRTEPLAPPPPPPPPAVHSGRGRAGLPRTAGAAQDRSGQQAPRLRQHHLLSGGLWQLLGAPTDEDSCGTSGAGAGLALQHACKSCMPCVIVLHCL
jgi:hypothetical protein